MGINGLRIGITNLSGGSPTVSRAVVLPHRAGGFWAALMVQTARMGHSFA